MPSPKVLKRLESIKEKGLDVEYPDAPWFSYNKEQIEREKKEVERRIAEAPNAQYLPVYPAERTPG